MNPIETFKEHDSGALRFGIFAVVVASGDDIAN